MGYGASCAWRGLQAEPPRRGSFVLSSLRLLRLARAWLAPGLRRHELGKIIAELLAGDYTYIRIS